MITGHGDVTMAVECMNRGAFDFVEKPFRAQRLVDSVQAALRLERRLRIRREARAEARALFEALTADERDVAFRAAAGLSDPEIAAERGIDPESVAELRSQAMPKLGVSNIADLVRLFDEAKR
jgi:FixJ family two-component response regulator